MKRLIVALTMLIGSSSSVVAYEKGDLLVRVGVTNVSPDDSSSNITLNGDNLGFGLNVDDNTQLGLNIAWFFTDKWNLELLASTPFKHDINVNSNSLGLDQLATVKHLPPTITANYYFSPQSAAFQPYAGIGVNYTIFFDEEFNEANESLGFSDLDLDESFGLSAQIGFDYTFSDNWFFNGSVRYIDLSTDATFTLNNAGLNVDNASGEVTVDIDPWVTTLSLGYTF